MPWESVLRLEHLAREEPEDEDLVLIRRISDRGQRQRFYATPAHVPGGVCRTMNPTCDWNTLGLKDGSFIKPLQRLIAGWRRERT